MIEILDDLNAQACCCDLTLCPVPVMDCESIEISSTSAGFSDPSETVWKVFAQEDQVSEITNSFSEAGLVVGGYSIEKNTQVFTRLYEMGIGGGCGYLGPEFEETCITSGSVTRTYNEPDPPPDDSYVGINTRVQHGGTIPGESCSWTDTEVFNQTLDGVVQPETTVSSSNVTHTTTMALYGVHTVSTDYLEGKTHTEWVALVASEIASEVNFVYSSGCYGTECESSLSASTEDITIPFNSTASVSATKARVRFHIPHEWLDQVTGDTVPFTGTYFKITYDIIEEPTGWDDTVPTVFRTFLSEDNVIEWTPTGTPPTDPDDAYWFTDWIVLDPPSVPGTRRIVNIRFICRENWFIGPIPQVMGEAVTLPDP